MTAPPILDFAEMQTEIDRLRELLREQGVLMLAVRDRAARAEAEVFVLRGTLAQRAADDQPAVLIDAPPNAPR